MDFVIGLPIFTTWKGNSYDSIFVIIDRLTKMVYYKQMQITIDRPGVAKIIIDIIIQYH